MQEYVWSQNKDVHNIFILIDNKNLYIKKYKWNNAN